jgi:hypothetical protein
MSLSAEQIERLLASEESETVERKSGFNNKEIRGALIAFANDQAGRGRAWLILGQAPNKDIVGLELDEDEMQLKIADIAKNACKPTIPAPSIEIVKKDGKTLAIVEVRASPARPHFDGNAWVRVGSQTRPATGEEILLMRAAQVDRKVALVTRWFNEGKRTVTVWQLPAPGQPMQRSPNVYQAEMVEVTEHWITLNEGGQVRTLPFVEFNVGYDAKNDRPQIRYHGAT